MIDRQSANQDQHSAINLMNYRLIRLMHANKGAQKILIVIIAPNW
jgi:hypothetical protein